MRKCVFFIVLFLVATVVVGCKTPATIVVPEVHKQDSVRVVDRYVHDTIFRDRYHTEYRDGQTVTIRDSVYVYDGHTEYVHDTIEINRVDSIPVVVETEVPVQVEKQLTGWQRFSMQCGWVLMAMVAGLVVYGIVRLVLKIKTGGIL